jgi:hypothetical protein
MFMAGYHILQLDTTLSKGTTLLLMLFTFHSHTRVFTNEHNSYLKRGVERPLVMQKLSGSHNIVEELMRMTMKTRRFLTYFSKSGFSIIMLFYMLLYRYMSNRCLTPL